MFESSPSYLFIINHYFSLSALRSLGNFYIISLYFFSGRLLAGKNTATNTATRLPNTAIKTAERGTGRKKLLFSLSLSLPANRTP